MGLSLLMTSLSTLTVSSLCLLNKKKVTSCMTYDPDHPDRRQKPFQLLTTDATDATDTLVDLNA